jgi:hypothetical protein
MASLFWENTSIPVDLILEKLALGDTMDFFFFDVVRTSSDKSECFAR